MSSPRERQPDGANDDALLGAELDAAIRATRRSFEGETGLAAATERRILESTRSRPRFRPGTWLAPLAAAFVASAALAHGFGAFGALRSRLFGDALPAPSIATSGSPMGSAAPVVAPAPTLAPPVGPSAAAPDEPASPLATTSPAAVASGAPPTTAKTPAPEPTPAAPAVSAALAAPAAPTPAASEKLDDMALYREAHRAHFNERNYALALSHWDRYLALAPRGAFALEARYNRGVALYRLGQRDGAVEALRPFAEGTYGGYRRSEAQKILEELR